RQGYPSLKGVEAGLPTHDCLARQCFFFFFFQAEDGIRDYKVTGVQTCALPISHLVADPPERDGRAAGGGIKRDSTAGFSVPGVLSKSSRKQWSGNGEHQGRRNQQDSARAD